MKSRALPPAPPVRESYGDNLWPADLYIRLWQPAMPKRLNILQRWMRTRRIAKKSVQTLFK
jgi:hypothetical protein